MSNIIDMNSIRGKSNKEQKENRKKSSEGERKGFKKLQLKKKEHHKNSTFDFTNFKAHVQRQKMRPISRSKSREKQRKGDENIEVSPFKDMQGEINYALIKPKQSKKTYSIPITVTDRGAKSKGSRSNSKTKTVSIHKINFAKDIHTALQAFPSMVSF